MKKIIVLLTFLIFLLCIVELSQEQKISELENRINKIEMEE
jgi:hypothetical protein